MLYCRVWHNKELGDPITALRKMMKDKLKLWRMIEETDLT